MFSERDATEFIDAYLGALIWSSDDESDEWSEATVSDDLKRRANDECRAFLWHFACFIDAEPTAPGMARAGHDFALTRNGHGAGFWDGDWPVYGDLLTKGSQAFGEVYVYVGDDGQLYS